MNIFLFFRDFRLTDNIGLIEALQKYKAVVPMFVFTPEQIEPKQNPYFSHPSVQFLCESLQDLAKQIQGHEGRLYIFYGALEKVLASLHARFGIRSLHFNIDYTPYARRRTARLRRFCEERGIAMGDDEDYLLAPMGTFLRDNKVPYHIYSAFRDKVKAYTDLVALPSTFDAFCFEKITALQEHDYPIEKLDALYTYSQDLCLRGGRSEGKRLLEKLPKNYSEHRNTLNFTTSHLAAYIKYGAVSVREVLHAFVEHGDEALYDQLIWREFYTYIAYYFPKMLQGAYFQKKYSTMPWQENEVHLKAWQEGKTGYPVVDACMRSLNSTGYMHNRGRLICANFLNRLLHLDWRAGERYFAQKLIDYDPAVNNGNWQWVASIGVDPKPYFQRLFNPFLQSKKFDPDARYIKKWLPQLAALPAKVLHAWDEHYQAYDVERLKYYVPIVEYKEARAKSLAYYRHCSVGAKN